MSGIGTVIIQQGGTQVGTTGPIAATVSDAPRGLASLPGGALLHGTVEGRAQGHLLVRTELGLLRLATQASLPVGTRVAVQVQTVGPQTTVHLYGQGGQGLGSALPATAARSGGAAAANPAAMPALPPGVPMRLAPGTSLAAMLQPAVTPTLAQALAQAGASGGGAAAGPGFPATGTAAGSGNPAAGSGNPAGVTVGATTGPVPGSIPGSAALGSARPVGITILSVHPPGASGAAAAAAQASGSAVVLTAVVTGSTSTGQTLLHTALGTVTVDAGGPVPRGTRFNIEVNAPRPARAGSAYGTPQAVLALSRAFPELGPLLTLLAQIDPTAAQALMNGLPQAGSPQMTSGLMFFISALRLGDPRGLVGSEARTLIDRAGGADLLRGLGDTVNRLGRAMAEQPPGEWRALPVPVANGTAVGTAVEQVMIYVRDHGDDADGGDGTRQGTRFIVEFSLSRFGQMQIDGLVHTRDKRFDLIVRSHAALSNGVRHRIATLFETANQISGFKGGVGFQAVTRFPVAPLEEMARSASGIVA